MKEISIHKIGTEDQPADFLTKILGRVKFGPFLERIMGDPVLQAYFERAHASLCGVPPLLNRSLAAGRRVVNPVTKYNATVRLHNGVMVMTMRTGSRKNARDVVALLSGEAGGEAGSALRR